MTSGKLSGTGSYRKTGADLGLAADLTVNQLTAAGVFNNQTIKVGADAVVKSDFSGATVNGLSGDLGFATFGLINQKPLQITMANNPKGGTAGGMAIDTASGGIVLAGDLAKLSRFLEVATASAANSYPYSGNFHLEYLVAKDSQKPQLRLTGGGTISSFKVLGATGAPPVFSEDSVAIQTNGLYNVNTQAVVIDPANPVSITMKSSGALAVSLAGRVGDVLNQRTITGGTLQMNYDLAKLWTIVKPMLSPAQQQKFADLAIAGKQQRTFTISGSLPAGKPMTQAMSSLNVSGAVQIDSFAWQGVTIQNFELPVSLKGGIASTIYDNLPAGKNAPKPAGCNGGTIDLGIWNVDLRGATMLLSMPGVDAQHPHQILKGISLNPALGKSLFGSFLNNPAFAGSEDAQGLVDLSVLQCQALPLGDLMQQQTPDNKGQAEVHYSLTGLRMGSTMLSLITQRDSVTGEIKDGDVKIAGGKITQDTTLMLDGNKPMHMYGVVLLKMQEFAPMNVDLPTSLLGGLGNNANLKYMPDQISISLKGSMSKPQADMGQLISKLIQDAAGKAILNGVLGGGQKPANQPPAPNSGSGASSRPAPQDPLGQLLQDLTKPKQ
jgi:hypothetical protein